jgi:histidine triad (HIT) family protein
MADSIFTRIIKGELPADKVYEDDKTIVIIPLYPATKAHVLVIPKLQVDQFMDLDDEYYRATWDTVKKVALRIREVAAPIRVGIKVEGTEVPHVHVHVLAFDSADEFTKTPDTSQPPDLQKNKETAQRLAF